MEGCGGAHNWARKLTALGLNTRIIAAHLVAPYRLQGKGGKNDANDAAAVCEAASRPNMHCVPVKTTVQQGLLCVHRLREGFKEERTACINRIRVFILQFRYREFMADQKLNFVNGAFSGNGSSTYPTTGIGAHVQFNVSKTCIFSRAVVASRTSGI